MSAQEGRINTSRPARQGATRVRPDVSARAGLARGATALDSRGLRAGTLGGKIGRCRPLGLDCLLLCCALLGRLLKLGCPLLLSGLQRLGALRLLRLHDPCALVLLLAQLGGTLLLGLCPLSRIHLRCIGALLLQQRLALGILPRLHALLGCLLLALGLQLLPLLLGLHGALLRRLLGGLRPLLLGGLLLLGLQLLGLRFLGPQLGSAVPLELRLLRG